MQKRILSMLLTIVMVAGLIPAGVLTVSAAGDAVYTVVEITAPDQTEPGQNDIYSLAGSFNGYDPTDPNYELTRDADGRYVLQKEFEQGRHNFRIVRNKMWETSSGTPKDVVLKNGVPAPVSVSMDEVSFQISSAGNVTVVFDPADMTVTASWDHAFDDLYENGFDENGDFQPAEQDADGTYLISNAGQLYWFAKQVNNGNTSINAKLIDDIVINENVLTADGSLNEGNFRSWTPIGKDDDHEYTGTFDGQGHTISGLYYQNSSYERCIALFGRIKYDGTVQNVGLVDSWIYSSTTNVSGIAASNYYGTVKNCYNAGSIGGIQYVGGIVSDCSGDAVIENCYNTGWITGTNRVGGIAGCSGGGAVITDCYNTGMIESDSYAGGIAGRVSLAGEINITNCYNTGTVTGKAYLGGILGWNDNTGIIENCYNIGTVSGESNVGGILGRDSGAITMTSCHNIGTVTGESSVGGILGGGKGESTVTKCYYRDGCGAEGEGTAKSVERFEAGEVAYLLGDAFGQDIGVQDYPVLGGDKVGQITGGTYSFLPAEEWIAEGCVAVDNGDGTWTVEEKQITAYSLWIGGEQVTSENLSGEGWNYVPETNILTLNNCTYEGEGYKSEDDNIDAAIYYDGGDTLNLVLCGTNTVTHTSGRICYGLYVDGSLAVSGSGTLKVTGGASQYTSFGVSVKNGSLTVSEGTMIAQSGTAEGGHSVGIYSDDMIQISGGKVTATGGTAARNSYGIHAKNTVEVSGGKVTATGGTAAQNSYGIHAQNTVEVSGGTLIAEGDTWAFSKAPVIADSHMVYGSDGKIIAAPEFKSLTYAEISEKSVAEVNGTPYVTIKEALQAAASSTTADTVLRLLADVTEGLTIASGVFTLDLNGRTVSSSTLLCVEVIGGSIFITDSSESGTGTIKGASRGLNIGSNAVCEIRGGSIEGGYDAVAVDSGAELTVTDGTIEGAEIGVTVFPEGKVTVTGGTISGGTVGMSANRSSCEIRGGSIEGRTHGVSVTDEGSSFVISGGSIHSDYFGISFSGDSCEIRGGTVKGDIFGVGVYEGNCSISGGTVEGGENSLFFTNGSISVSGGSFSHDPADWVIDGFKSKLNSDTELYDVVAKVPTVTVTDSKGSVIPMDGTGTLVVGETYILTAEDCTVTEIEWYPAEDKEDYSSIMYMMEKGTEFVFDAEAYRMGTEWDETTDVSFNSVLLYFKQDGISTTCYFDMSVELYSVDISDSITGGSITANPTKAIEGEKVTITVTPDTGKEVVDVIVTGGNGREIEVTVSTNGIYTYEQPAEDVIVEAVFKLREHDIVYMLDGAEYDRVEKVAYGTEITRIADPSKTGYTFSGWSETPATMPDHDIVISGTFTINSYTICFDTDGGSAVEAITQDYCTAVAAPADPEKTGFDFGGWYADAERSTAYVFGTMPADNITVYAKWNPAVGTAYTVKHYHQNTSGSGYTLYESEALRGTTNAETEAEAKNYPGFTAQSFEQTTILPDGSAVVEIRYDRSTYTVTLVPNGGIIRGSVTQYTYGIGVKLPVNVTRSGFSFRGWYDNEDCKGNAVTEISAADTGDKIFYAKWSFIRIPVVTPAYPPVIDGINDGDGIVSPENPNQNDPSAIVSDPDAGYAADEIGDVAVKPEKMPFTDVPGDSYYAEAVSWAVENGISSGISDTLFDPNGICTRAQAVTFLWRASGSPEPESTEMPFRDVPADAYFYKAVLWAVETGITRGTSDITFSPYAECTRAQIVTFLWRSQNSPAVFAANPFMDVDFSAYYIDAVLWAVKNGITSGTSTATFSPDADCSRAQIVTFLYRCLGDKE